jgi:hypothetical protein
MAFAAFDPANDEDGLPITAGASIRPVREG